MYQNIIFLLTNLGLLFSGKIDTRIFILSTASLAYFVNGIPEFDSKKPKSYIFPIVRIILYIVYANIKFN